MAKDWQTRLRAIIDERPDVDMKNLSLRAGLGETGVRDLLKRHANPKLETVRAVLRELNLPLSFLDGAGATQSPRVLSLVPVIGEAAAGVWVEQDVWDDAKYEDVPAVPHKYASIEQRAWRISGPSMNMLRIEDGDFVITVPYWMVRSAPQDDDVVIVQRSRGAVVETTCKQVDVGSQAIELWPRSSDPRYQTPFVLPHSERVEHDASDDRIEIVGLVIGKYLPM